MKKILHFLPSAIVALAGVVSAAPKPFYKQGTVPLSSVSVFKLKTGEGTNYGTISYEKPVLARASDGGFLIGNRKKLIKLDASGAQQWKLTFSAVRAIISGNTFYSECWRHSDPIIDNYNLNRTSDLDEVQAVFEFAITHVFPSPTGIVIVARVLYGNGPMVYVARFDQDGRFVWRQTTSVGTLNSQGLIGKNILAAIDYDKQILHVVQSGPDESTPKPVTLHCDIDLVTGLRGSPYAFGFNNSSPAQSRVNRVVNTLLLPDGKFAFLTRRAATWVTAGLWQEAETDRVEIYNPTTKLTEAFVEYPRSIGTPFTTGHVASNVSDIALDSDGRIIVLRNTTTQLDGPPYTRHQLVLHGLQPDLTDANGNGKKLEKSWSLKCPQGTFADKAVIRGNKLTTIGNPPDKNFFRSWQLARFNLKGNSAPARIWRRDLPYDSPYFRMDDYESWKDMQVDKWGNVYLSAVHGEYDSNSTELLAPQFCYVKYSDAGHLQFFRPIKGPLELNLDTNESSNSASPFQLLLDEDAAESSSTPVYHFGLVTTVETRTSSTKAPTKKWYLVKLERENIVAAPNPAFQTPRMDTPGFGTLVGDDLFAATDGNLQTVIAAEGTAFRTWIDSTLPAGMFANQGSDGTTCNLVLNGPITAPYGEYPVKVKAATAHGTVSKTYTVRHLPAAPSFNIYPVGGLAAKGGDFLLTAKALGYQVKYQWQKKVDGKWKNISGATKAKYKAGPMQKNTSYRVVASNIGGSATSLVAQVTLDAEAPVFSVSSPAGGKTTKASTTISGTAVDNLAMSVVRFRYRFAGGTYTAYANAAMTLTDGGVVGKFSAVVPTGKKGVYTIQLIARDTGGNARKITYKLTRE